MEICRACLSSKSIMIPLNETFVQSYNLLTNLNVLLLDNMPQFVCEVCSKTVKSFITFRYKCTISESVLQQMAYKKNNTENVNIPLKKEINAEKEYNLKKGDKSGNNYNHMEQDGSAWETILSEVKAEKDENSFNNNDSFNDSVEFEVESPGGVKTKEKSKRTRRIKLTESDKQMLIVKQQSLQKDRPKRTRKKVFVAKEMVTDVKKKKLECGLCENSFKRYEDLREHVEGHKGDSQCAVCLCLFTDFDVGALLSHRITHLPDDQQFCHLCKCWIHNETILEVHYMVKHHVNPNGEKYVITCKGCDKIFEKMRPFRNHWHAVHNAKSFICDHCSKVCNSKQTLLSHMKCHFEEKAYVCDSCGFSCKRNGSLKAHKLRMHAEVKFSCKACSVVFSAQKYRDKHNCQQVNRVCSYCGKQFHSNKSFSLHIRHHNGLKHRCSLCPATFVTRSNYVYHMNQHEGVPRYQCNECERKFYRPSVLRKHKMTHTGEKPYKCKICQKGFTANYNLKVHMKVHGEYLVVKKNVKEESDDKGFVVS